MRLEVAARRTALALLVLLAGLATGVSALALHVRWWGLALVVAATAAALAALPPGWWGRPAFVLGWEVPVLGAGLTAGPGGDVVVTGGVAGYLLLALALVIALGAALTLPRRRRPTADESGSVGRTA